ncbi:hypothetical protein [Microtetraspora sp. NBRC 16547]|uniref:hypothetical protein n=1 Tax=Microtetraspora sp. NBRC 16547 TaxID=3030993 RepID=UPI0024A1A315|nr:hypothetical protein [Microtetraspora sp. NBRC 16547]GLX00120.1 hypothetical protein Misp02_42060 [Microtetraspora sp. NBRC 16547]
MKITYPVPAETTSVFVVATDRRPVELDSVVPWRMSGSHRRAAAQALGTSRLDLQVFQAAQSPWPRMSVGDEGRDAVRRARHHVVVTSTAPVAEQPEVAQAARAVARGVADAYGGVIVDLVTGVIVPHRTGCEGEPHEFRLGDDWLGWTTEVGVDSSCPPWDPAATDACTCLTISTRGLRRFGLPEVMLEGAACAHSLCTVSVLRTVARHLLAGHLAWTAGSPDARCRTIGEHLWLGDAEPVVVSGAPHLDREPFRVRLGSRTADATCLSVGPPSGFTGTVNDWLCSTPGLLAA